MTSFQLGCKFGLVFIADNSFREQKTRKDLLASLKCIRRHLKPNGVLLITERRIDRSLFPDGLRTFGWSDPLHNPDTGEAVSRRGELRLSTDGLRTSGRFVYKTSHADGTETIEQCPLSAPVLTKEEYISLFAKAGSKTQTYIDYHEKPDDGKNPILCFVCRPV